MNLVQFLVAGVNGASSGTATFLLRGTASSAAAVLYNDFEGIAQPGTNIITLDANGSAEVYCDAYVDVVIKNSAGATLRTVTVGNSAPLVEVQSTSFTGTDYDGSPANTLGEPISLKALLDKWIVSAGSPDWKVLSNGVPVNIQTALGSVIGVFVNVKDPAYGAVGDGVTDDTTAILAAHAAAAGGVLYFPAGTYKITTISLSGVNVNWLGAGAGASIISGTTSSSLIGLTDNTNTGWKNFTGLSFTSSGAYSRLFLLEENQNVSFARCSFDGTNCSINCLAGVGTAGLSKYLVTDCDFTLGASTNQGILNACVPGDRHVSVAGCNFKVPAGFAGSTISGPDFAVTNCRFDASLVTSGIYRHVDASSTSLVGKYVGTFTNNKFIDGGSSGFAFKLDGVSAASSFVEQANTFIGYTDPVLTTDVGRLYDYSNAASIGESARVVLGSRLGKSLRYTESVSSNTIIAGVRVAETVVIKHTFLGDSNINLDTGSGLVAMPPNAELGVAVFNDSGGTRNVTFNDSNASISVASVASGAMAYGRYKYFLETTGVMRVICYATQKTAS